MRRCTPTRRTRMASSPHETSCATTPGPATTSSPSPTIGIEVWLPRPPGSSSFPVSSSTACCPRAATGTCSASGSNAIPAELEVERRDLAETGEWIVGQGGVAYLAHPYWTGARPAGFSLPPSVAGIEVFNAGCELEVGRGLSSVHWDELLEDGRSCPALVTDDSHHPGFDTDHAWTWLARRADGGERPRRAARRPVLRQHRAGGPRRRGATTARWSSAAPLRAR